MNGVGRVESLKNEICTVSGLANASLNGVVSISSGGMGLILGFDKDIAQVILFRDAMQVKKGDLVRMNDDLLRINVGDDLLGRIIDPLGLPIDGLGEINPASSEKRVVEGEAKTIYQRRLIKEGLQTGVLTIDSQIPIGLGQRELFLGERRSGQSDLAIDIICNQARLNTDLICVYVAIDLETVLAKRRIERIAEANALGRTVIVLGRASESASLNYIAPMSGATVAEYFAQKGRNVLIVFDDLTRHAKVYRHLSLLLGRPASREAYPGDIFYLHSRLLERQGCFNDLAGGGSITALPIVETLTDDVTDFITTNLMSITDGHVLFRQNLANRGIQPPIDSGFSVSRIGGRAQRPLIRALSDELKEVMIRYADVERFMTFGSEISGESKEYYELGKRLVSLFHQENGECYSTLEQAVLMYFIYSKQALHWQIEQMTDVKQQLLSFMKTTVYERLMASSLLDLKISDTRVQFDEFFKDFAKAPDTTPPAEKHERINAETETIASILRADEENIDAKD
jgi:F-type H+/Na+-transporting ATPase subunit alpha